MYYTLHCAYCQLFKASGTPYQSFKVRLAVALKEEAK